MLKEVSAQANVIAMLVGVSMECHLQQRPVLDAWHRTKMMLSSVITTCVG
jgi:hypothetical protein